MPPARTRPGQPLSNRERAALTHAANGLSNRQIAAAMNTTEDGVKSHLHQVMRKLGATSRGHAVALGVRAGYIGLRDIHPTEGVPGILTIPPHALHRLYRLHAEWQQHTVPENHTRAVTWWHRHMEQLTRLIKESR